MSDIAIIGGGAAGAAVFGELLRRSDGSRTVHWVVEGPSSPGRGIAYGTAEDHHLLNVRAAGMGLFSDQPEAFLQHAHGAGWPARGSDFLPRRLFGDFLQMQVEHAVESARQRGIPFALRPARAIRVSAAQRNLQVHLDDGPRIHATSIVLALGALPPNPLPSVTASALASGHYAVNPWAWPNPQTPPRRVLVLGTGLTAVDTVLSAATRWPQATIHAVSRRGHLPLVHPDDPAAPAADTADLHAAMLECTTPGALLRCLRRELQENSNSDPRAILDSLRPINSLLWQKLDLSERERFLRHVRWAWEIARHRMPPASARAISELRAQGRLVVDAARVMRLDGDGPLTATVRNRADGRLREISADFVVQATGLDTDVDRTSHTLVRNLLADGLARPDGLGLGLAAQADGRLLGADGAPSDGLYAIGSLLRGTLWECTALPEIRVAARDLAGQIAGERSRDVA